MHGLTTSALLRQVYHFAITLDRGVPEEWVCPRCDRGRLFLNRELLFWAESPDSEDARRSDDWDETFVEKRFTTMLRCEHCAEAIAVAGIVEEKTLHVRRNGEYEEFVEERFFPRYVAPSPRFVKAPRSTPAEIVRLLEESFILFWQDPSSAGNKLRQAVERLMDHLQVATGSSLHQRLVDFAKSQADLGDRLLAIKWIGNAGSHQSDLTSKDVIDAYALMEYVLHTLFDSARDETAVIASDINARKGPRSRP